MEKQHSSSKSISSISSALFRSICILSPLVVFLTYFMFKNIVNATIEFFLRWTCISILAVTIGLLFQFFSALKANNHFSAKKYIPFILITTIIQGLVLSCLITTHQPGPDQMSRIYMLSGILFVTIIHTFWIWGYDIKGSLYEAIGRSIGIDSAQFSKLIVSLSTTGIIILWVTIAILMTQQ